MRQFLYLVICSCVFLLVGCRQAPAEVAQATAVPTAAPSETAVPTGTPEPPATLAPTETATTAATETATASPAATQTSTPTAAPPTATPTVTVAATNTAVAAATQLPVAPPPPAPPPSAANLLSNPGFELGAAAWEVHNSGFPIQNFYTAAGNPQFVHSGQQAAFQLGPAVASTFRNIYFQRIENVSPGLTYRAAVWVKIWSSSGENRTLSENPGDFSARLCLNTMGEGDPLAASSVCTGFVRPLDSWQRLSVDGVAASDRLAILLVSEYTGPNRPTHNEAIWDDATVELAAAAATATPPPPAAPARPQPVAFAPAALRDSMNGVRSAIEQAGGLLDRLYNGEPGQCAEYQGYYDDVIRSATYTAVPEDWAGIYNDYIFAVENFLASNQSIDALCDDGGGNLSSLNYGAARSGINDSLNRLIPAIEAANGRLGG